MMSGYFDGSNTCADAFVVARATASVMAPIKLRANMVVFPSWAILFTRGHLITHRATQNFAASAEVTPPSRTAGSVHEAVESVEKDRSRSTRCAPSTYLIEAARLWLDFAIPKR